jgi:hypothetical protein
MFTRITKLITSLAILLIFFTGCTAKVEKEFGTFCGKILFDTQRHLFSSDIDGSVKFQIEESTDKSEGRVIIGGFSQMSEGIKDLVFDLDADPQNCTDCIFMFLRDDKDKVYRVVSGKIDVELIYFDTKERVVFAKGRFLRMVLENESGNDCNVIENMEFKFY